MVMVMVMGSAIDGTGRRLVEPNGEFADNMDGRIISIITDGLALTLKILTTLATIRLSKRSEIWYHCHHTNSNYQSPYYYHTNNQHTFTILSTVILSTINCADWGLVDSLPRSIERRNAWHGKSPFMFGQRWNQAWKGEQTLFVMNVSLSLQDSVRILGYLVIWLFVSLAIWLFDNLTIWLFGYLDMTNVSLPLAGHRERAQSWGPEIQQSDPPCLVNLVRYSGNDKFQQISNIYKSGQLGQWSR